MANLSDKVAPSGVLTPTGDGSGLSGILTPTGDGSGLTGSILVNRLPISSDADWTSDTTLISDRASTKAFVDAAILASGVTSSQVGAATAGIALGAVGSYALLRGSGSARSPGTVHAGSGLNYTDSYQDISYGPSGSWRVMGYAKFGDRPTVFLRIS